MKLGVPGVFDCHSGDCLEVLPTLPEASIDSVVTDPPYGLKFMGKGWDHGVPGVPFWTEVLRVMKPGVYLLAFGGTRTYHRLTCAIEDAGFEIRDCIMWVYGSGFPKSHNISKAIDKAAGAEPIDLGQSPNWRESKRDREKFGSMEVRGDNAGRITAPATPEAQQWDGWGTALKPAWEPIIVARKPFKGTVAANVLEHGTGGINIDGCRVGTEQIPLSNHNKTIGGNGKYSGGVAMQTGGGVGRFPANLIHDGSDEVTKLFPEQTSGGTPSKRNAAKTKNTFGAFNGEENPDGIGATRGTAARFFYCAKASKADRNEGLDNAPDAVLARSDQAQAEAARGNTVDQSEGAFNKARLVKNNHPTVKPTSLMQYLVKLVTPPGGVVLDPFAGSFSTGKAVISTGFQFTGIEKVPEYFNIGYVRCAAAYAKLIDNR